MKIALTGAHATGKTTRVDFLSDVFELMDMPYVKLRELAAGCPYPINKKVGYEAEDWILTRLIQAEREADKRAHATNAIVISDRTVWDVIPYCWSSLEMGGMSQVEVDEIISKVQRASEYLLEPYTKIWFPWPRECEIDTNNPVRELDKKWQLQIHQLFVRMIDEFGLDVEHID